MPSQAPSQLTSTPIYHKRSGRQPYSSATDLQESPNLKLAAETSDFYVGPMPCKFSLESFLPLAMDTQACLPTSKATFKEMAIQSDGEHMYTPFVRILFESLPLTSAHFVLSDQGCGATCSRFYFRRHSQPPWH